MQATGYTALSATRIREDKGFYFDDFEAGMVIEHMPGRTVIEADNSWQSLVAMNQHPLHIDAEYARGTEFGRPLVSSLVTFAIVNGMTVHTVSQKAIANLGWDKVRLSAPVFIGDTLYAESEVLTKRLSATRPGQGIVTVLTVGMNQRREQVIRFERTILLPLRQASER
jgi:itaconyl-CoA hydratase